MHDSKALVNFDGLEYPTSAAMLAMLRVGLLRISRHAASMCMRRCHV
jgi:hypothetical protein